MRYFFKASYRGTHYAGWQRQPADPSVQQTLEEAFSLILREEIRITGCGRTDAGVHARQYYFHCDTSQAIGEDQLKRFNRYLPKDIGLHAVYPVPEDAHARFSAIRRSYAYHITFSKDPFSEDTALWYPHAQTLDRDRMKEVAALLPRYDMFKSFCKEGSDAKHFRCQLFHANWIFTDDAAVFVISANRFLRGMVRLIVGACLQVGRGKISLEDVQYALDNQLPLDAADSIAAHGLHLIEVAYPDGLLG